MGGWHAGAVTIALAGTVAVAMGQGTKELPLFTEQQAVQGKKLYATKCAVCHGETLQGGAAGPLAGPAFAASTFPSRASKAKKSPANSPVNMTFPFVAVKADSSGRLD